MKNVYVIMAQKSGESNPQMEIWSSASTPELAELIIKEDFRKNLILNTATYHKIRMYETKQEIWDW